MTTEEQRQGSLSRIGIDLDFLGVIIKGRQGQKTYSIESYSSPTDIQKQSISFIITMLDRDNLSIGKDTDFTMMLGTKSYYFVVLTYSDLYNGWCKLQVALVEIL